MGLAERRAAKEFETKRFPQLKSEIEAAAGFEVPVEVNWEQLAIDDQSHLYDESWPKVYFKPLIEALKEICCDQMGKDALKDGLKKIRIQNSVGNYSASSVAHFGSGVLTIEHEPTTNVDDIKDRAEAIQKVLEKEL